MFSIFLDLSKLDTFRPEYLIMLAIIVVLSIRTNFKDVIFCCIRIHVTFVFITEINIILNRKLHRRMIGLSVHVCSIGCNMRQLLAAREYFQL